MLYKSLWGESNYTEAMIKINNNISPTFYLQFTSELKGNRRRVSGGLRRFGVALGFCGYLCSLGDCWPRCFDQALGCCCPVQWTPGCPVTCDRCNRKTGIKVRFMWMIWKHAPITWLYCTYTVCTFSFLFPFLFSLLWKFGQYVWDYKKEKLNAVKLNTEGQKTETERHWTTEMDRKRQYPWLK